MKKNNTKKTIQVEDQKFEETPILEKNETKIGEISTKKVSLTTLIREKASTIHSHITVPFSLGIEEINKDTMKLVNDLWNDNVSFVVSSLNLEQLQDYHDEIINRSNSLGRWKVVNPDYFLLEPVNLRIFCTPGRLNEKAATLYADEAIEFYKD